MHSKPEPASVEEKEKLADVELIVPDGPAVIDVSGAAVSTVKLRVASEASVLPAASLALTEKVCEPSESPVSSFGDEQAAQAPASSLHSKLDPSSVEEKEKLAELDAVTPDGPPEISVSGAAVSTTAR